MKKFEASFAKKNEIKTDASGNKSMVKSVMVIAWNSEYAIVIGGESMPNYFTTYLGVYKNYGFENNEQENLYGIDAIECNTSKYTDVPIDTVAVENIAVDTVGIENGAFDMQALWIYWVLKKTIMVTITTLVNNGRK